MDEVCTSPARNTVISGSLFRRDPLGELCIFLLFSRLFQPLSFAFISVCSFFPLSSLFPSSSSLSSFIGLARNIFTTCFSIWFYSWSFSIVHSCLAYLSCQFACSTYICAWSIDQKRQIIHFP